MEICLFCPHIVATNGYWTLHMWLAKLRNYILVLIKQSHVGDAIVLDNTGL